jgi:hypothetical protein
MFERALRRLVEPQIEFAAFERDARIAVQFVGVWSHIAFERQARFGVGRALRLELFLARFGLRLTIADELKIFRAQLYMRADGKGVLFMFDKITTPSLSSGSIPICAAIPSTLPPCSTTLRPR